MKSGKSVGNYTLNITWSEGTLENNGDQPKQTTAETINKNEKSQSNTTQEETQEPEEIVQSEDEVDVDTEKSWK